MRIDYLLKLFSDCLTCALVQQHFEGRNAFCFSEDQPLRTRMKLGTELVTDKRDCLRNAY